MIKVKEESVKTWIKSQHSNSDDHGIWSHHFIANRWREMEAVAEFIFLDSKITVEMMTAAMKLKDARFVEEKL